MAIKTNRIHNPQIISDPIPQTITSADVGRIWLDSDTKTLSIGGVDQNGNFVVKTILDSSSTQSLAKNNSLTFVNNQLILTKSDNSTETIDLSVFTTMAEIESYVSSLNLQNEIIEQTVNVVSQTSGDLHYDQGYDFLNNGYVDDYYVNFYIQENEAFTVTLGDGTKVKPKTGLSFSKITLLNSKTISTISNIKELSFNNGDVLKTGFALSPTGSSVLLYCDPTGKYIGKQATIKFI